MGDLDSNIAKTILLQIHCAYFIGFAIIAFCNMHVAAGTRWSRVTFAEKQYRFFYFFEGGVELPQTLVQTW